MSVETIDVAGVREVPDIEAAALFDRQARQLTGFTGDQFVARWRAGEFSESDDENVMHMVMLLPLVVELPSTGPTPATGPLGRAGTVADRWLAMLRRELRMRLKWPERTLTKR